MSDKALAIGVLEHTERKNRRLAPCRSRWRAAQLRKIELLQERRTALISAAVTGKIDVGNLKQWKST